MAQIECKITVLGVPEFEDLISEMAKYFDELPKQVQDKLIQLNNACGSNDEDIQ